MYRELKSIDLIFENCDYVNIPRKYIGQFGIENIKRNIRRTAINSVTEQIVAETVAIELSKDLKDLVYHPFGSPNERISVFDRLTQYSDITGIDIHWDTTVDSVIERVLVSWGEDDFTNEYETVYESLLGNLYIVISESKTFDDMFDKEIIDEEDFFNLIKKCDNYCKKEE